MIINLVLVEAFLVVVAENHSKKQKQKKRSSAGRQQGCNSTVFPALAGFSLLLCVSGQSKVTPAPSMPSQF